MKPLAETKKSLFVCSDLEGNCPYCHYAADGKPDPEGMCIKQLVNDSLRHIEQLEAERDAAVEDIKQMVQAPYEPAYCEYCKKTEEECAKVNCWRRDQFEWRGVQKEG